MGLEALDMTISPPAPSTGVPAPPSSVRWATFFLMAAATYTIELASLVPGERVLVGLFWATGYVLVTALLMRFSPSPEHGAFKLPKPLLAVLLTLVALPFLTEPLRQSFLKVGHPLEIQCMAAMRNFGLALAVLGGWNVCLRMSCVVSLFLTLFAISIAENRYVLPFLGLYSVAGIVWLSVVYWSGLGSVFAAGNSTVREHLPWGLIVAASFLVAGVLAVASIGPKKVAAALGELMPFSGGTGEFDKRARGGVNDGDEETNGRNARSTGFAPSNQFLDSPLPSLYDMVSEKLGEPLKPDDKEFERAIALSSDIKVRELPKPPADNLRPSRDFSTVRKEPKNQRDLSSRSARALFEIEGPTPLHIRATAYDFFDGVQWHEPRPCQRISVEKDADSDWMRCHVKLPQFFSGQIEHKFKIAKLEGNLVPTPPYLECFRLGRVNEPGFFGYGSDQIVRMTQRKLPGGVIVETESRTFDRRTLRSSGPVNTECGASEYYQIPSAQERIRELAREWTNDIPRGWQQIEAVMDRLKRDYELDWNARPPVGCLDTAEWFLFKSKRGPDYQFASAAAVMLRHLGYPTRVVSGFYAGPAAFDPETDHTPVVADDIHFWPEVMLPGQRWIVLEPTPGYEVMETVLPWWERITLRLQKLGAWCQRHVIGLTIGFSLLAFLIVLRKRFRDLLGLLHWRLCPGRTWREWVRNALRIVERRARYVGCPRPVGQSPGRWLGERLSTSDREQLMRLAVLADWASYGPEPTAPVSELDVWSVCRQVLDQWTLRRLRREHLA